MAAWDDEKGFYQRLPVFTAATIGSGVAVRLLKNVLDAFKEAQKIKTAPSTMNIPVPVDEDQAKELEAAGVHVKTAGGINASILGFTGTLGAYGGYKLTDWLMGKLRKQQVQEELDSLRSRIKNVLEDAPAEEDVQTHALMKAAEDMYFKNAGDLASGLNWLFDTATPPILGYALGGAGAAALIHGFRKSQEESRMRQEMGKLKEILATGANEPPMATTTPVLVRRKKKKLEEPEVKSVSISSLLLRPKAKSKTESEGSPAQQAAKQTIQGANPNWF